MLTSQDARREPPKPLIMSQITFLRVLLLTLLVVPTLSNETSSEGECRYTDACSGKSIFADVNDTFVDSCKNTFLVTDQCKLSRRCRYTDVCSGKSIFAEDGVLRDSCGGVFDVAMDCTLSRRANNEANNGMTDPQTADPESSSAPLKPSPSFESGIPEMAQATVTPRPGVPRTTPSTQSSPAENNRVGMNVTEGTKTCCYRDRCSRERICAEDGMLMDECGDRFDVALDCGLTRKEEDEGGRSPESSQTSEIDVASVQATPEATLTSPSAFPSSTPSPSITGTTNEDDTATSVTSEAVCIHIQHLSHLPSSALLYLRHVLAHVLCDSSASCATPGHMVIYKGESMRMSGYCEIVGCERKQELVNSPRYSRGGRVDSHSKHLVFTMLAARFETRFEEVVLAGLVRAGL